MKKAFLVEFGRKYYILISDKVNITDDIARKFIVKILELRGVNKEQINIVLQDRVSLDEIKRRCNRCTLEIKDNYYSIKGKYFGISIPFTDEEQVVIFK